MKDEVKRFVKESMGRSQEVTSVPNDLGGLEPDMALRTPDGMVLVSIERRADLTAIARLGLAARLLEGGEERVVPVMAAKSFSDQVKDIARRAGIRTLVIPRSVPLEEGKVGRGTSTVRLTSEKSWKIVAELIGSGPSSIRGLSLKANVSYGWAHAVCDNLLSQGLAGRRGSRLEMMDLDRLLNGVAWERPFRSLVQEEFVTDLEDVFSGAREIDRAITGTEHVFAGYLAGSLYTGQAVRFDMVQLYMGKDTNDLRSIYSSERGQGITIQVLTPDRDVMAASRTVDGIPITSPAQTLLDLAGMGASGMDMNRSMLRAYAKL